MCFIYSHSECVMIDGFCLGIPKDSTLDAATVKDGQRFRRGEEKQNDGTKQETNKTKHTKSEIYSTKLVNEWNGMKK